MEPVELVLLSALVAAVFTLIWRAITLYDRRETAREEAKLASTQAFRELQAMRRANRGGRPRKKPKKQEDDDQDDGDEMDELLDAVEPWRPLIQGYVEARRLPVDIGRLFDERDPREKAKVAMYLEKMAADQANNHAAPQTSTGF